MDVLLKSVIKHMSQYKITTLIHGHTHKPGLTTYDHNSQELKRYVLSDWDDSPKFCVMIIQRGFISPRYKF